MRHAIPRKTHTWTPDADNRLMSAVEVYGTDSWALGTSLFCSATAIAPGDSLTFHPNSGAAGL